MYNLAAGTAHQEVFYFSRAIHKIGYTIDEEDFVRKIYEAVEMDSEEHIKERLSIAYENT